jgi:glycosyltransferase involved in cell wall biosynthesis
MEAVVGVRALRNQDNLGFTETVNRGLKETTGDVVILNSDAEVPPRWLENLVAAAYHKDTVATVTPLSNNAGAFSAPIVGHENEMPAWLPFDELGRRVTHRSARRYPRTPTGNGFCLYIKRGALNELGYFDSYRFPRGYGEENDFCMRALNAGWENVVDDATFLLHELAASFGEERQGLMEYGRKTINRLYPSYTARVQAFVKSDEMVETRNTVADALKEEGVETPLRVLSVVHSGRGGTPATNLDLMATLQPQAECFVLECDTRVLRLSKARGRTLIELEREGLDPPLRFGEFSRKDYKAFVARVLMEYGVEVIHVRHLVKHTLDVAELAKSFDVPLVMSLHDYYLVCPTIHLLDEKDNFCGGICTETPGQCRVPMDWIAETVPPLKHDWVHEWQSKALPVLEGADALVTTTQAARETYVHAYPQLAQQRWEIIEHGRDMEQSSGLSAAARPGEPIRVLLPGSLDVHKGSRFIRDLKGHDVGGRLELHFLGAIPSELEGLGVDHGRYERDEFAGKVREIAPSFIGLFSITAETYMHSLTEAWAAGVPVVATDIGALGERIRQHGGGWLVDPNDPLGAYRRMMEIADDPSSYRAGLRGASVEGLPSTQEMGGEYMSLYRSVLRRRQRFSALRGPGLLGGRELRARVVVVGREGHYPGSAHVRALRRFSHPTIRREVDGRVERLDEALESLEDSDVLFIERTAVPPCRVREVVERANSIGTSIILDLDDNLVDRDVFSGAEKEYWLEFVDAVRVLAASATAVTVSTEALGRAVGRYAEQVLVIPNALDERLWFAPGTTGVERRRFEQGLQLLYMGTRTHEADLDMFKPIMERVWSEVDKKAQLNVIGGEPDRGEAEWYRRVPVPKGCSNYPQFVQWLRSVSSKFDVGVAPLAETEFNKYKSDLKFLEYSALGLPGVYSRSPAYSQSVVQERTGLLAGEESSWVDQLKALERDAELRRRIAERARDYVVESRTLRARGRFYLDYIASAVFSERVVWDVIE